MDDGIAQKAYDLGWKEGQASLPSAKALHSLGQEIHRRVLMLRKRAKHPHVSRDSLRMEYVEIRGMCLGYYIASGAWPGRGDPRETITDYTRDVLGLDLPALAAAAELACSTTS